MSMAGILQGTGKKGPSKRPAPGLVPRFNRGGTFLDPHNRLMLREKSSSFFSGRLTSSCGSAFSALACHHFSLAKRASIK
jgi:hypothetical protein